MLCDCFGNMMRVELTKLANGVRLKTGEIIRICDRCAFNLPENDYQKWVNQLRFEFPERIGNTPDIRRE